MLYETAVFIYKKLNTISWIRLPSAMTDEFMWREYLKKENKKDENNCIVNRNKNQYIIKEEVCSIKSTKSAQIKKDAEKLWIALVCGISNSVTDKYLRLFT